MNSYEAIIGLEIHAELNTKTKMFCRCFNDSNERHPNVNACPICMGHPGTLPVINKEAVRKVIVIGMATHGEISEFAQFDRKQYFYPDLPKGYQISQYKHPIVQGGYLDLPGLERRVRLTRIHLEEDAGRLSHVKDGSLVDYNRASVPLMELVTEPDVRSSAEAKAFAEELQLILRYTGVSHADMEKGEMRIEANVSIHKPNEPFGTKVEVKNINSFKAVEKAIEFELKRQAEVLEKGGKVIQETRGWDDEKEITVSQRLKEEANDYRYFPEPDLPPLRLSYDIIQDAMKALPELPEAKRTRFRDEFGIPEKMSEVIIADKKLAEFFEEAVSELREWLQEKNIAEEETAKGVGLLANYLTSDLTKLLNEASAPIGDTKVSPENFAELITILMEGKITSAVAKTVLVEIFQTGSSPAVIIQEKNLGISEDSSEIDAAVEKVIANSEKAVADYKGGKQEALQYLVGQAMKELRGRSNPHALREIFIKKLS
jgi:aspartyl-tRNA(Asn)/glutamyl-tRNA(Gln) amidotransferase subunit B